jgi:MFS-type transporter involved in bile tolerance (Atg22 family)
LPIRETAANAVRRVKSALKANWLEIASGALGGVLFSVVIPFVEAHLGDLKAWLLQHPAITGLILTAIAIILGSLASYWKRHEQRSYGVTEVAFGAAFTFNVLLHIAPHFDFSKVFAVGSGVYIIARGFNNLFEARK